MEGGNTEEGGMVIKKGEFTSSIFVHFALKKLYKVLYTYILCDCTREKITRPVWYVPVSLFVSLFVSLHVLVFFLCFAMCLSLFLGLSIFDLSTVFV